MLKKVLATAAMAVMTVSAAQAQTTVVFDSATGVTSFGAGGAPGRSFMGQAYNAVNPGGPLQIKAMDFGLISFTAQTYTDIVAQVQFWNIYNPAATGTTPIFSSPVATFNIDLGAGTLAASSVYTFEPDATDPSPGVTFATPVSLSGFSNLGVTIAFQGNTGSGLVYTDNLTAAVRGGAGAPAFAKGSVASGAAPSFGYFRNASGRTDFNFLTTDGRQIGDNSALYMRLYAVTPAVVPEPSQYAALSLGVLGLGVLGLKARRRGVTA